MTPKQTIELAKQAGFPHQGPQLTAAIQRFAELVRNAALEEAAVKPVAWRLKDDEASAHYGRPIHVYYDGADIRLDHPDATKLTKMLEPLYTHPKHSSQCRRNHD